MLAVALCPPPADTAEREPAPPVDADHGQNCTSGGTLTDSWLLSLFSLLCVLLYLLGFVPLELLGLVHTSACYKVAAYYSDFVACASVDRLCDLVACDCLCGLALTSHCLKNCHFLPCYVV